MINGISNYTNTTSVAASDTAKKASQSNPAPVKKDDTAVVYESSKKYKADTATVKKLWADAEARTAQFRDMVSKLIGKQGDAIINAKDMWQRLRTGDFTADEETVKKAQEAISENGYYGVNQTSDRIIEFAKAVSGNDPKAIETLKNAFVKGFKEATKAWGDTLPDISQKTYDAVMEKFDKWADESKTSAQKTAADDKLEDITFGTV